MKRVLFIILVLGHLSGFSQTPRELMQQANDAYARSEYSYAIELYEQILEKDLVSAELYYNLGNAYFKNNRMGKAILNYERASRLNPSDDRIAHNLRVANSRIVDRMEQRTRLFYENWWKSLYMMQTERSWAITTILLFSALLAFSTIYLFSKTRGVKKTAFYISSLLLVLSLLTLIFAQKQYNRLTATNEAIIMTPRAPAKSTPSAQGTDLFVLHEGTKVTIISRLGDWKEISLPNGNVGWLRNESLEVI